MYLKRKSCCKISSIVILLSFKFLFLPLVACQLLLGLIQLCRLKRWHGSLCRVLLPNTTSERWRFCREPSGMTLHTRKTWQVPLRHNSYQAARKRIGELREEKVSCKRVMICKTGLQPKEKIQKGTPERYLSCRRHSYRKRTEVRGKKGLFAGRLIRIM